jgi:hypothetical protein
VKSFQGINIQGKESKKKIKREKEGYSKII